MVLLSIQKNFFDKICQLLVGGLKLLGAPSICRATKQGVQQE